MAIAWHEWSSDAFERARREKKPVLLVLVPGASVLEGIPAAFESVVAQRFVAVRVDPDIRPDVFRRYLRGSDPSRLVLSEAGEILLEPKQTDAPDERLEAIRKFGESYKPGTPRTPAESIAWTGAVGGPTLRPLDDRFPMDVLADVKAIQKTGAALDAISEIASWRMLAYAASEWGDQPALEMLDASVASRLPWAPIENVRWLSDRSRLCFALFSLTGKSVYREAGSGLITDLVDRFFDEKTGFFKRRSNDTASPAADINAQAVLALLRACEFPGETHRYELAEKVLHELQKKLYDPLLGMIHARTPKQMIFGLLDDNAWAMLAFTEAFLMTGHKPYREFADELGRLLFQEFWNREGSGFLDRSQQANDIGLLKNRLVPEDANAVALEGIWRLSELKGNANYKKWVKAALQGLYRGDAGNIHRYAGLAAIHDALAKGRFDLELVGLLSDPKTEALLAAVTRLHLPRKIVSFVDPNDQDYILAHKLEAPSYPRLFACGPDLRRVADTDDPAKVPEVVAALRRG